MKRFLNNYGSVNCVNSVGSILSLEQDPSFLYNPFEYRLGNLKSEFLRQIGPSNHNQFEIKGNIFEVHTYVLLPCDLRSDIDYINGR